MQIKQQPFLQNPGVCHWTNTHNRSSLTTNALNSRSTACFLSVAGYQRKKAFLFFLTIQRRALCTLKARGKTTGHGRPGVVLYERQQETRKKRMNSDKDTMRDSIKAQWVSASSGEPATQTLHKNPWHGGTKSEGGRGGGRGTPVG